MPPYKSNDFDADALCEVVKHVEELGEDIVSVVPAGNVWVVITKAKKSPRPKAQTR